MPDDFEKLWAGLPQVTVFAAQETETCCTESKPFAEWCARLVSFVAEDPSSSRIVIAKAKCYDAYCRWHAKTTAEHRAETNTNHPCFHQLLLGVWHELENLELCRAVSELAPPSHQVIEARPIPREESLEPSGVVAGYEDAE